MTESSRQSRWPRWVLAITILPTCWLGMMAVHELGHVLGAWIVGAEVERVVLHPFSFSRTDVAANDCQRFVIWMGPVVGVLLPLMIWGVLRLYRAAFAFAFKFFAGFCLIANGLYIGYGRHDVGGDAKDLHDLGESGLLMSITGTVAALLGLGLWSHVREEFGFGAVRREIDVRLVMATIITLAALLILGFMLPS